MVRRRATKGRKDGKTPKPLKRSDGTIKKWNTIEDIPMDEEDQFHHNRDKILLEGDYAGGADDDGDEDEVFALKGVEDDSEDDEEGQDHAEYDDDDEENDIPEEKASAPKKKKQKEGKKAKGKKADSDEEEEEEEEEESWGKGRGAYYSSNANELESDDEEGNELEEQESKRLQTKMRQEMADEDFGLNDNPEFEPDEKVDTVDVEDPVPSVLPPPTTDKKALLRHLEKTSPEALALARDWEDTVQNLQKTKQKMAYLESQDPDALSLGMIHMHYQALLSYSTVLAFYLHLRSSAKYAQRPALLQSHPIMHRLLTLKQALQTLEDLDFAASDSEDEDEDDYEEDEESMTFDEIMADGENVWSVDHEDGLDSDELNDLLDDAKESIDLAGSTPRLPPKKKRKTQREKDEGPIMVTPVFDLVEPEFVSSKSKSSSHRQEADNDLVDAYGEATALHSVDAADKTARKKSLRFHTSKIDSATARRQGARNQAAGGDDDIPYRERKSAKEARLVKEAAIRAQNQVGAPLDDEEPEPRAGQKRSRGDEDDEGAESPDDYYELVKNKSKETKMRKKEEYEAASGRARVPLEEGEAAGPRSLTRAILTNKGLTPHRPKAVRNPRVKKRQKFEKAKKKIASQKAVYKGGLSAAGGRYDGERSGITKVVKSVPLG